MLVKISELEKIVKEQEWKNKHTQYHKTYSVFVYLSITVITLYGIYRLGQFILTHWQKDKTLRAITGTTGKLNSSLKTSGTGNSQHQYQN
jgi:hypothetical protein